MTSYPVFEIAQHNLGRAVRTNAGFDPFKQETMGSSNATIIKMDSNTTPVQFNGKWYSRPNNTAYGTIGLVSGTKDVQVEMGRSMARRFASEADLSASYSGVTASAGAQYNFERLFKSTYAYAIFCNAQDAYSLSLANNWHLWVNSDFIKEAKELQNWDQSNEKRYEEYDRFFRRWGTHVMTKCFAGVRYQMRVEQKEMTEERKDKFATNVKVEYEGVVGGNASVTDQNEKALYDKDRQRTVKVLGGDREKADLLSGDPSAKNYEAWTATLNQNKDGLVRAEITGLGRFLKDSPDSNHRALADNKLLPAVDYFSSFLTLTGKLTFLAVGMPQSGTWHWAECSIPSLPGLKITPEKVEGGWNVTQDTQWKVRVTRQGNNKDTVAVPLTITFPVVKSTSVIFNNDYQGAGIPYTILSVAPYVYRKNNKWEQDYRTTIHSETKGEHKVSGIASLDSWGVYPPQDSSNKRQSRFYETMANKGLEAY
ncbi:hypothetical protein AbraIFM66951_005048 [Aspergillus brasiliensis]|uniref:MACPF domain-containing protein n=1 Tax=Aspergillus brasiliensis TaxID=319629 RepID=A0A9W5YJ92_9EURO|nr:hypothetical protein AbraCBS73388_011560 [Aspergillus brasiliensis]GKZ51113.1 hypothetical protein AbraIFM66951_005048 [Aspergillus brasiliensis]